VVLVWLGVGFVMCVFVFVVVSIELYWCVLSLFRGCFMFCLMVIGVGLIVFGRYATAAVSVWRIKRL
jgi:hypothetical protein